MAKKKKYEFLPDRSGTGWLSRLYLTPTQRRSVLKWSLYGAVVMVSLLLQDVVFAQLVRFGGTASLVPGAILLAAVLEDEEKGGLFALAAALFYQFSGSAPGRYVIALLPALAVFAAIFRESFLRRGISSAMLCAGVAQLVYQLCVFVLAVFFEQTTFSWWPAFLSTALQSLAVMLVQYPVLRAISKMGGETWKE